MKPLSIDSLAAAIEDLVALYAVDGLSPIDINSGYCADFATIIWEQFGRDAALMFEERYDDSGCGYTWLSFEGRHFDAECPRGVERGDDLPLWKR